MADDNTARPGDTDNVLLRKIANRLEGGLSTSGGSSGPIVLDPSDVEIGAVEIKDGTTDTRAVVVASAPAGTEAGLVVRNIPSGTQAVSGPVTDAQIRATPLPVSGTVSVTGVATEATLAAFAAYALADNAGFTDGTSKVFPAGFIFDDVAGTALTENDVAAARIDSKRAQVLVIEDATTRGRKATVSAGGALLTDASATTQPVSISAGVGGKMAVIKDTTAVTASSAYSDGNAVGGKRTLANALGAAGTGVLESIMLLDRANQKPALEIYIFDADPTNATLTDKTAFVFSTDDLKVLARISVATGDWVTHNSKATACIKGIGAALKSAGTSLYAAVVLNGSTPTFAATTDFQIIVGILQD